ncbi:MAG: DHA2 family efflux MFS transporter permease subunit [Phreatobacter sp.]|uniref:DHA2 family efflux MFS transporter permease subunit n=1 Tax=Phreatobacter sp. TaxID=1966341 RepID=UPI001A5D0E7F|nr:DHA2 family efflux MFS transporter permease subunit [Phreatobacter sp.]MBL8571859.1 DHA2 family efflux MFS transporter permease subunit [Phreatobacter sp.]
MSPARAAGGASTEDRVDPRRLVAFLAMIFGMFMAILDIQIVSASLVEIQAGLSASSDEIAYVQTSYLIAEVIMIPLSGFLARILSTRILFTISAAGFTAASVLCGMATSIEEMVVFRALQGFIGGGMIPTTFAASFAMFPLSKRHIVMPMMGLVVPLAPTIGPTVGGLLTDAFSWHWLFYVNLVPGIGVTIAAWTLIDYDQPNWGLFRKTDWSGLFAMAGFLGTMEYVLEEGPSKDWFADDTLCSVAAASAATGLLFFWRAFRAEVPIVDLRAFANRNFALGSLYSVVMGAGLFGLTYLYPLYLARIRGFTPLQIGETMFVTGAFMFLTAPIASRLVARMDPRAMLLFGFSLFSASTFLLTDITKDWDFRELLVPQILRGCSLMFCMIPINNLALGTLPVDRLKNAAGLYNLMRNLGGALGLALINTVLNQRLDLHLVRLREQVGWGRGVAVETLAGMAARFGDQGVDGNSIALKRLGELVRREALVMSFADIFLLLSLLVGAMIALIVIMERPRPAARRT